MSKPKRLRIKRLNPRFPTGKKTGINAADDSRLSLIDNVPIFANDGWFLLVDGGGKERSWYQIQGKAYVPRDGDTGASLDLIQSKLAQHFRWVLGRCEEWENEIGKEATAAFSRMLWRMRKVPREIWHFMHTQQTIQYSREEHRKMGKLMREWRASKEQPK